MIPTKRNSLKEKACIEIRIIIIALIIVTLIILLVSAGREVDVNTDKQVDGPVLVDPS